MSETITFDISNNAATKLAELLKGEQDTNALLRISVLGGGCSGFQYNYEFDSKITDEDTVFRHHDVGVIIDPSSASFVNGATLDYVETLGAAAFEIKNPNADSSCGCGNSFSVDMNNLT